MSFPLPLRFHKKPARRPSWAPKKTKWFTIRFCISEDDLSVVEDAIALVLEKDVHGAKNPRPLALAAICAEYVVAHRVESKLVESFGKEGGDD